MSSNTEQFRQNGSSVEEIPPTEDLMREHGILKRILLIYNDVVRRLIGQNPYDPQTIQAVLYHTASISHRFIEEYHQKLEEDYVFPEFLRANKHVDLVQVLQTQHQAAEHITKQILNFSATFNTCHFQHRYYIAHLLSLYIRMYEPHEAREDTVLFPALRDVVGPEEFKQMGEKFEEIEHERFGEEGFQRFVNQIAEIEKVLGIYELSQFTPQPYELFR